MLPPIEPIRVLVADDHAVLREGLKNLLSCHDEITLVAIAANGQEALELTAEQNPDVIILDIKMPVMSGRDACLRLLRQYAHIKVIAFSMFDDEQNMIQMRLAGATGYLLKNAELTEIHKAIRVVHSGGEYYSEALRGRISALYREGRLGRATYEKKEDFSELERQIIALICRELTSKEIADQLGLSKRTVEHHKEKISEKMGVQTSVGIAVYALNNYLLC